MQANRTLARLKTFFSWALDEDLIDNDPTARVRRRVKETARDRALSDDEIRLFWAGCDKLGWPFGPIFKLLLLTAQRRDEVGTMEWAELDAPATRRWTIPREKAKNDRAHEVHLSELAVSGSLPPDPGLPFISGMAIFGRQAGDTISTVGVLDRDSMAGSITLHAGWQVGGEPYGAPNDGYVPVPGQLLRAVVNDPTVAYWPPRRRFAVH